MIKTDNTDIKLLIISKKKSRIKRLEKNELRYNSVL